MALEQAQMALTQRQMTLPEASYRARMGLNEPKTGLNGPKRHKMVRFHGYSVQDWAMQGCVCTQPCTQEPWKPPIFSQKWPNQASK